MNIGDRIRKVRGDMSAPEFCENLDTHKNTLYGYEKGKTIPNQDFLVKLCKEFDVNPEWLLLGTGPMRKGDDTPHPSEDKKVSMEEFAPSFDSLGMAEGISMLAKIYTSADTVYIRAINANLLAFTDAIDNKSRVVSLSEKINQNQARMEAQMLSMSEQISELKREVLLLRNENSELKNALRARGGHDKEAATG